MRTRVTTTLRADLWQKLQIRAIKERRDCNEILEELLAEYFKKSQKGGQE